MIFIYNSLKFSGLVLSDNLITVFGFILKTFKPFVFNGISFTNWAFKI